MAVRPAPALRKLVIIEEGLILSMATSAQFLAEFPFLRSAASLATNLAGQPCNSCGGKANTGRSEVLTKLKQTLAGMPDTQRRKLKELLNAAQVRVTFKQGNKIIQHTF
jgi:hypothetical protein